MMTDENEKLTNDAEHGGLKSKPPQDPEPSTPQPGDEKKVEQDPSQQPS